MLGLVFDKGNFFLLVFKLGKFLHDDFSPFRWPNTLTVGNSSYMPITHNGLTQYLV